MFRRGFTRSNTRNKATVLLYALRNIVGIELNLRIEESKEQNEQAENDAVERILIMGRKKIDRSDKVMQTFESTKPLINRLKTTAQERNVTVSALIRYILEHYFENREI